MMKSGALNTLELVSKDQGRHMDSPESVEVCTMLKTRAQLMLGP